MTPAEIMRDLARDDIFPKNAMAAASADRETMVPIFVELIGRLATQPLAAMREADLMALVPVLHLVGQWQEPRAYKPLALMLRRPSSDIEHLLGDAATETSFRVIAGTFDGDPQPVFDAIDDNEADEFARSSLMSGLVMIAQLHPAQRPVIEDYFRTFRWRCPEAPSIVLTGWMDSIADLGLEDMSEAVRDVFDQGLIPKEYCDFEHFLDDLRAALDAEGSPANHRYHNSLITDAIDELSKWHCYSDAFLKQQKIRNASNDPRLAAWTEPFDHPTVSVGRNGPCPCGSGKKYKKCCLH